MGEQNSGLFPGKLESRNVCGDEVDEERDSEEISAREWEDDPLPTRRMRRPGAKPALEIAGLGEPKPVGGLGQGAKKNQRNAERQQRDGESERRERF